MHSVDVPRNYEASELLPEVLKINSYLRGRVCRSTLSPGSIFHPPKLLNRFIFNLIMMTELNLSVNFLRLRMEEAVSRDGG
jgi:hypothetical protein